MKKIVTLFTYLACLGGCATAVRQEASAGQIGCPKSEVVISEETDSVFGGTASWVAICRSKRFYCSAVSGGQYGGVTVSCKEELKMK